MSQIQIRPVVVSDLEPLVALEARAMHFPMGHHVREWFREDFPSAYSGEIRDRFLVAEHDGELVAAAALLPVPITYRGVPLMAGMWEAVVTDAPFRGQGLCRQLFAELEARSTADVHVVQGLTWLYRRFGYHPALRSHGGWDSAGRVVAVADLPESPLTARPAVPEDASFLNALRNEGARRSIVACPATEAEWRWTLHPERTVAGPGDTGLNRWREWRVLLSNGEAVGAFMHDPWTLAMLTHLEIVPGATTWREAGATAVRETAAFSGAANVRVTLPPGHPLFAAYPRAFERTFRGYGDWAARISDPVAFLRKIAPALEPQLAGSAMAGWSGEVSLSRIDDGATLQFEAGRLVLVEPWTGERPDHARVRLTPGRFEALVFGYRSIAELLAEDADCAADEEAQALLAGLFPPGDSEFRPL